MNIAENPPVTKRELRKVIIASTAGTLIEWYDFFVYGSLAVVFSGFFFPSGEQSLALLISIAAFGTGFVVRPLGAVVFGRLGDRLGRKRSFLATLLVMGASTALIGVLPTYSAVGIIAPLLLVLLRLLQGLAVGGEYGGAAVYVAEYSPANRRGTYTSFLQTTATAGFLLSILVVVSTRVLVGEQAFADWGWRIPFLLSALLVVLSVRLRLKLHESPEFKRMKATGTESKAPVRDTLANRRSLALILLTLFGVTAGLGVAWYTSQFYALYFLQSVMHMDFLQANICIAVALILGTPFFVLFGWLSDRYGRLPFISGGLALSALSYYPLYGWMQASAQADSSWQIVIAVLLQLIFTAMVYGPTGAFLTELFPPQIRYTGLSVSYQIGTGVFGGFTPLIALTLTTSTGLPLAGLIYPIAMTAFTAVVGVLLLRGGRRNPTVQRAWDEFAPVPVALESISH